MTTSHPDFTSIDVPLLASLQSTLDEPLFPGKLVIWLLLMLSIVAWVSILSKSVQLARAKGADRRFLARLRGSQDAMEVYGDDFDEANSPHFLLYCAGAREAAWQLLGIKDREADLDQRIRDAGILSVNQSRCLRTSLEGTCRKCLADLRSGLRALRLIGATAILAGICGASWSMMSGFDRMESPDEFGAILGTGLGFFVVSLFVAVPAILGSLAFEILLERREVELLKFRDDLARLFERRFGVQPEASAAATEEDANPTRRAEATPSESLPPSREQPNASHDAPDDDDETPPPTRVEEDPLRGKVYQSGKKQYRSIRDRLLADSDEYTDPSFEMNPIARQAAAMRK